jgi:hypothetical protein
MFVPRRFVLCPSNAHADPAPGGLAISTFSHFRLSLRMRFGLSGHMKISGYICQKNGTSEAFLRLTSTTS